MDQSTRLQYQYIEKNIVYSSRYIYIDQVTNKDIERRLELPASSAEKPHVSDRTNEEALGKCKYIPTSIPWQSYSATFIGTAGAGLKPFHHTSTHTKAIITQMKKATKKPINI